MLEELILLILLLLLSGFFSGSEMAYIVANKLKIEIKARKNNPAAISANYFTSHPQIFFSTILIGNNIVNVTLSSLSAVFLAYLFGLSELSILIISAFLLLIIGELIPKYIAHERADSMFLLTALPVRFFSYLFYPFVKAASLFSKKLTQSAKLTADTAGHLFDKEDIKELVKESEEAGVVDKKESDIIEKVIELGGTITGEHGIGITKAPYMEMEFSRPALELMSRIKKAFDPQGILNPGKILL